MARGDPIDGVSEFFGLRWETAERVRMPIRRTCTLDRRNRSVGVPRGEVRHEDGRLLATAVGSFSIVRGRGPSVDAR